MMPGVPVAAYSDTMAVSGVCQCRIRVGLLVGDRPWQKSGRTRWQDKSRDVRLGRSGRWCFNYNGFAIQSAMCATARRCAFPREHLIFLGLSRLASQA